MIVEGEDLYGDGVLSPLILAKGSTAIDGLSVGTNSGDIANPVDPHWPGNILDLLLARILEGKGQPVAHGIGQNLPLTVGGVG